MKGNKKSTGLGNALLKAKNRQKAEAKRYFQENKVEEIEVKPKVNLESVTERDTLAEFLYASELQQRKFNVRSLGHAGSEVYYQR